MNGTSSTSATQVICYRNPAYTQWWYITLPAWTLFFMVPILAFGLGIWFRADYRSRDMAVMVTVASCGYCVYYFVKMVSSHENTWDTTTHLLSYFISNCRTRPTLYRLLVHSLSGRLFHQNIDDRKLTLYQ